MTNFHGFGEDLYWITCIHGLGVPVLVGIWPYQDCNLQLIG